jgi:hypothetical protein
MLGDVKPDTTTKRNKKALAPMKIAHEARPIFLRRLVVNKQGYPCSIALTGSLQKRRWLTKAYCSRKSCGTVLAAQLERKQ